MAFKARHASFEEVSDFGDGTQYIYTDVEDYIVLGKKKKGDTIELKHIVATGQSAAVFDDEALDSFEDPLIVNEMAIERNGLRGKYITVALGFGPAPQDELVVGITAATEEGEDEEEEVDVAGIYGHNVDRLFESSGVFRH